MFDLLVSIPIFFYTALFEILLGFLLGITCFIVLGTVIYAEKEEANNDLTRKVYDSLLSEADDNQKSEVDKYTLMKLSPKEFDSPLQLLSELVRRKIRGRKQVGSNEKLPRSTSQPKELVEPTANEKVPDHLKPELFFVLKALEPLEIPTHFLLDSEDIEILNVEQDVTLLKPGDLNDTMIVVVSGEIGVFTHYSLKNVDHEIKVKNIRSGDWYFSTTSIIDVLMNLHPVNKYLHIRSVTNCRIAKYKLSSFYTAFQFDPGSWVRTIQVVMTRLQHCTLFTCNSYLGIGGKCIDSKRKKPKTGENEQMNNWKKGKQFEEGCKWMADFLGVPENVGFLMKHAKLVHAPIGTIITEQNSFDIDMIFCLYGQISLKRSGKDFDDTGTSLTFNVWPGDLIPSMQILTNEPSMCASTAIKNTIYMRLSREHSIEFLTLSPMIYLRMAYHALQFVSPFARVFDSAVSWIRIDTGQALYRSGDESNSMFIVMGGRLRSIQCEQIIEEYGRLDVIGISDLAEKKPRKSTVLAVRFSHLVCVSDDCLTFVKLRYPQVGTKLLQLINRSWKVLDTRGVTGAISKRDNLRTIAIVPASRNVPLVAFSCELYKALSNHIRPLRLSSTVVGKFFDASVMAKKVDFGMMHWLSVQEISYPLIIYQCDYDKTNWTRRCMRMADVILVVGLGTDVEMDQSLADELMSSNEKLCRQNKELILLWPDDTVLPKNTSAWMKTIYYSGYHHLRMPKRMLKWARSMDAEIEEQIIEFYEKSIFNKNELNSDFARLARILTGNAIGVVFGGGGARGAAHAGALKALLEKEVKIDMVGGTSIGALFGAFYATTPDMRAFDRMKDFFHDRATNMVVDVLSDLTWIHTALLTGHKFNKAVQRVLGNVSIEDSWISYFCITTDISNSSMRCHRAGIMWPVVRSSMSIAGYLPPLCDPQDGHLLLDGAYVNNLPADVMRSFGANIVLAIDVGMADDNSRLTDYGYHLSGFWVLFKKYWPFGNPVRVLSMSEVQNRLTYVCCVNQLEAVKKAPYCQYIKLPTENLPIFNFTKFEEAWKIGYESTLVQLNEILGDSREIREKLLGKYQSIGTQAGNKDINSLVNLSMLPMVSNCVPVRDDASPQLISPTPNTVLSAISLAKMDCSSRSSSAETNK